MAVHLERPSKVGSSNDKSATVRLGRDFGRHVRTVHARENGRSQAGRIGKGCHPGSQDSPALVLQSPLRNAVVAVVSSVKNGRANDLEPLGFRLSGFSTKKNM
jgi:hypothetical protein